MSKDTNKYPRVGEVNKVRPQGVCAYCGEIERNDLRPARRIHIQHDWFRGNDDVLKGHGICVQELQHDKTLLNRSIAVLKARRRTKNGRFFGRSS